MLVITTMALACSTDATPLTCHFGAEHTFARSTQLFDAIRLLPGERGVLALWSSPDGLWTRPLDHEGAPLQPPRRVGARCDGGLEALREAPDSEAERVVVACLRRPTDKGPGAALLLDIRHGRLHARRLLGEVGRDTRGIDFARRGEEYVVAWHDGSPGAWVVWAANVPATFHDQATNPRLLSSPRVAAGAPSVWIEHERATVTWGETWLEAGFPRGQIMVWSERGAAHKVADVDVAAPAPQLIRDERSWVLFFRDMRRPYRKVGLFVVRLDDRWRTMDEPRRVGRANARATPHILRCAEGLACVSPRTWDEDLLVGINLLDANLDKRIGEQQVYEWDAHFSTVAATCTEGDLLTAVGERGRGPEGDVAAHTILLRCE